jgi:hypothetical protein
MQQSHQSIRRRMVLLTVVGEAMDDRRKWKADIYTEPQVSLYQPGPTSWSPERPIDLKDPYEVEAVRLKRVFSRDIIESAGGPPASKEGAIVWSCGKYKGSLGWISDIKNEWATVDIILELIGFERNNEDGVFIEVD